METIEFLINVSFIIIAMYITYLFVNKTLEDSERIDNIEDYLAGRTRFIRWGYEDEE